MRTYFYRTPEWFKRLGPNYTWDKANTSKKIYLTFDDGPSPKATPYVLDLLQQFNAKSTFFVVGENVERYSDLAQELVSQGHQVGNHTYNHLSGWHHSNDDYLVNIARCQEVVSKYCDAVPRYFRPPYGRIKPSQGKKLREDYEIIMWSLLSGDFDVSLNPKSSILSLSQANVGDILVFHDNDRYLSNLQKVLPAILGNLSKAGFKFAAL